MGIEKKPIGVFDSGLGGISVLKRLYQLMPNERFLYFGDSANAPYGEKDRGWILERSREISKYLIEDNFAKALVVACNTATSVACAALREEYRDIPVIGLEPALKPAVESDDDGAVVVMATPVTLSGEKFSALLDRFKEKKEIIIVPAPKVVDFVENGVYGGEELEEYLEGLFSPYKDRKIASVVLGCTHFPFVRESIENVTGNVKFYDGAFGTARETLRRLEEKDLLTKKRGGGILFRNSIPGDEMIYRSMELFRREI
ncbi:MAG: glutamate racemase [Clostridia bacterium]|nr:glutamate racemase [Clostridia bacterium]